MAIARTPQPPYYAAVITVERAESDDGYFEMADAMHKLAQAQPGFLGMEWVYDAGQRLGQERCYRAYTVRIARVERDYQWTAG